MVNNTEPKYFLIVLELNPEEVKFFLIPYEGNEELLENARKVSGNLVNGADTPELGSIAIFINEKLDDLREFETNSSDITKGQLIKEVFHTGWYL